MPSNDLIFCHPLLLLPSIFPSIRVFSNESALCMRWPKYWSFSFNISPSNEYPGLISFGMDWLDLLAVQGTLKSLLQHHSSKASTLQCSAFFIVQLSHPYMATGKTIALTRQTLAEAFYLKGQGHWGMDPGSTPSPFSSIPLNLEGEQVLDKKENNILDREVNHKLDRGTHFKKFFIGVQLLCNVASVSALQQSKSGNISLFFIFLPIEITTEP